MLAHYSKIELNEWLLNFGKPTMRPRLRNADKPHPDSISDLVRRRATTCRGGVAPLSAGNSKEVLESFLSVLDNLRIGQD
jgi:hypothetical protein